MSAFWSATALLPGGWAQDVRINIANGLIVSIEAGVPARPDDETHKITLPGLANVHSHAFQRGMAGLAEHRGATSDDNFWSWREVMYRFLDRLTPDDMEAIAAMAYAEMLETGYTHVGEFHYLHNDAAGRGYADLAAGVLCPQQFWRANPKPGAAPLHPRSRQLCAAARGVPSPTFGR
jgi:formimidoylglutamate deiminase